MRNLAYFYYAEVISWFVIVGIQAVIMPWLALKVLELSGAELGLIILLLQAPSLILLPLVGGLLEKIDKRKVLLLMRLLMIAPPVFLFVNVSYDTLSFEVLCMVNVLYGFGVALLTPSRDSMLHKLSPGNLQSTLATFFFFQMSAQAVGYVVAGFTGSLGLINVVGVQLAATVFGIIAALFFISKSDISVGKFRPPNTSSPSFWQGLKAMFTIKGVRETQILSFAIGFCFIGTFLVSIPILIKSRFGGEASDLSLANGCFLAGTIMTTLILRKLPTVKSIGIVHLVNLGIGTSIIFLFSLVNYFALLAFGLFIWGASAGIGMSFNRLILESHIPSELRTTAMSWMNFGMLGTATISAQLFGYIADYDPRYSIIFASIVMALVLTTMLLGTSLTSIRSPIAKSAVQSSSSA